MAEALKRAKGFKSKDPFFMICMRPSFVGTKLNMIIPSVFAKNYLLSTSKHQDVILKVQDGRTWSVKYYFRSHGRSPKTRFEGGWKAFAEDNNLKLGNVCAFVLRKSTGIMLFEVVIFCENGVANSPMLPELNVMTKESRSSKVESCSTMKEQALERASCSQTKRPSFSHYACSCLPYKFVEKYISKKECEVRLWVSDGRSWFVQLRVRQRNVLPRAELLSHGWKSFALDNSLRAGDICTFELTNNGNEISFKVSIVKIADDACNKQVANKRRTTTPSKRKRNPCVKVESSFNYDKANMIPQNLIAKIEQEKIKVEPSGML
ncbi:putative B3 domain-containing protein REM15 [Humulus lupulus]|uniref:putative B3 domain-containing protein REM15 n=1 Tax=Humulus lupulus TaxID=3486 RepID=UPI002B404F63|nr:putative B3 domain-containing protein REM15 [Humulus lupulus]